MLKPLFTSALVILLAAGTLSAKSLSPEEALQRLQSSPMKVHGLNKFKQNPRLVHTALTESGQPAVYVFAANDKGYMVVSADDVAYPMLGYAESGTLDTANMPEQMKWWLEEYSRQIEYATQNGLNATSSSVPVVEGRQAIAPMIKTHWDQDAPYNALCPVVNGARSYTGCVATAMAQIMKYWEYPAVGTGKISYNDEEGCGKRLSWDFSEHPFDWDNMLDEYAPGKYTEEQGNAVAVLMKSAGASVKMSYSYDSSGALSLNTQTGLVKYLGYDPNLEYVLRSTVSSTQWDRMVYDNLVNVGPILYGGGSMLGGGHSFIIDGYDGKGYYHFNWGWSEMSDGYYSLDALNPSSLGNGGGSGGGYNFTQDGVFGIQPPTGAPAVERPIQILQMGTLTGSFEGSTLNLSLVDEGQPMWVNYSPATVKVQFGVIIKRQDVRTADEICLPVNDTKFSLQVGYGANANMLNPHVDFSTLDIEDGVYTVTMAALDIDATDAKWVPMLHDYGCANYVVVTKEGNSYSVEENNTPFYTIDSVEFDGDLYYGCLVKVKFTITNPNDIEISRGIAPMLYTTDGSTLAFMGDGKFVTLQPGETVSDTFVTEMYLMSNSIGSISSDTEFLLTIFDESSYNIMANEYVRKVVMHPNPGVPSVTIDPMITITGERLINKLVNGQVQPYYKVYNPGNLNVKAGIELKSGLVAYPVYVCLLAESTENEGYFEVIDVKGDATFLTEPGERKDIDVTFNFSEAVPRQDYYLSLAYGVGTSLSPISGGMMRFVVQKTSDIDDINSDDESLSYDGQTVSAPNQQIEIFGVDGVKVAQGNDTVSTAALAPGIYVARTKAQSLKLSVR